MKASPFPILLIRCFAITALLLLQTEASAQVRTTDAELSVQPVVKSEHARTATKTAVLLSSNDQQQALQETPSGVVEPPVAVPAPTGAAMRTGKPYQPHRVDPEEIPMDSRNP
jgi:hypothetical protein